MSSPGRTAVLFVCESVSLAHVSRAVFLSAALDPDAFDVHLACDARYDWLLSEAPHAKFHPLPSIDPEYFRQRVDLGTGTHSLTTARAYLRDELQLYEAVTPDLVVADLRYTASTSAAIAGIRSAIVANAYWSPHRVGTTPPAAVDPVPTPAPRQQPTALRAARRAKRLASRLIESRDNRRAPEPEREPEDLEAFNIVRAEVGLAPFDDYPQLMTGADHVLYAEPPGLIPMRPMPDEHRFIGPVVWSPRVPEPEWWPALAADRPIVYVGLGSTGEVSRLQELVRRLAELEATIVVSTAGRGHVRTDAANVVVADLVPGDQVCRRAALVIGSGGSGTGYQAIQNGAPLIGLWSNEDQYLSIQALEAHGAAIAHGASDSVDTIMQSVSRALHEPSFTETAQRLGRLFSEVDTLQEFRTAVESIVGEAH